MPLGNDHALALTADGHVYAWGKNTSGQLGNNNTNDSNYARLVLNESGTGYLSNIVDITGGYLNSSALDKDGNVWVWGNGTNGEIGNLTVTSTLLPKKASVENIIQISMGRAHIMALDSGGVVWVWGYNADGELGIGYTTATANPLRNSVDVTEVSCGSYHSVVKKMNGTVETCGFYKEGILARTATSNQLTLGTANLPDAVADGAKVKYIKGGIVNTTILLSDGTVWSCRT